MKAFVSIDITPEKHIQVSIGGGREKYEYGYRIAGPKYDGRSRNYQDRELDERDIQNIRKYLTAAMRTIRRKKKRASQ